MHAYIDITQCRNRHIVLLITVSRVHGMAESILVCEVSRIKILRCSGTANHQHGGSQNMFIIFVCHNSHDVLD